MHHSREQSSPRETARIALAALHLTRKPISERVALPKVSNRRRHGYELTSQRDMTPIAVAAGAIAAVVHLLLYFWAPSLFHLELDKLLNPERVLNEEKRVFIKPREVEVEQAEPEPPETPPEPQEIVHEPQEIDLLDVDVPEMDMAPGKTELPAPRPVYEQTESAEAIEMKPAQLDAEVFHADPLDVQEMAVAEPAPLNTNDVIVQSEAPPDELAEATDTVEQELRRNAAEQGREMPADTRSLAQLMGEENLGSSSGVARLGADLLFGFDECQLRNSARITMLQLAALIRKNPETYFLIEGHTDSLGSPEYNALLGLQRAAAVRAWLMENNIPVQYVYIRSCGNSQPLAENTLPKEQQALNRRVEIHMRRGGEQMPADAVDSSYKVDTKKKVSEQLAAGVRAPQKQAFALKVIEKKQIPRGATAPASAPKPAAKPAAKSASKSADGGKRSAIRGKQPATKAPAPRKK